MCTTLFANNLLFIAATRSQSSAMQSHPSDQLNGIRSASENRHDTLLNRPGMVQYKSLYFDYINIMVQCLGCQTQAVSVDCLASPIFQAELLFVKSQVWC